jgi:hypothetical protein
VEYPSPWNGGTLTTAGNLVFQGTADGRFVAVPGVDNGGNVRNLGFVPKQEIANLKDIVFNGPFKNRGMPDFTGKLKDEDVIKIQAFIQGTADAVRPKK